MKSNKDIVTLKISKEELKELLMSLEFLYCLEDSGVDNWGYYDEALKEFNSLGEEYAEELLESFIELHS